VRVRIGTSGYSYDEWKGSFYPESLKAPERLRYYAERFETVEINNTFYRMPRPEVLLKWRADVPPGFVFVLKAPQRITHQKRLKGVAQELGYFLEAAGSLGPQLGPLLFQLPPYQREDRERLRDFLALLPAGVRAAFEFRHASWFTDAVYAALAEHGAALCAADTDDSGAAGPPLVRTAPWAYLRLRRADYDDAALGAWLERLRAQAPDEAWVFFKHEDEAKGPALARRLRSLVGD